MEHKSIECFHDKFSKGELFRFDQLKKFALKLSYSEEKSRRRSFSFVVTFTFFSKSARNSLIIPMFLNEYTRALVPF